MTRSLVQALLFALAATSLTALDGCGQEASGIPECLQQKFDPSDHIYRCTYEGRVVYYYRSTLGYDLPSYLYDANCNVICSPDGGFGGTGDGRCTEFNQTDAACEVIWLNSD